MTEIGWPIGGGRVGAILRGWSGPESSLGPTQEWSLVLRAVVQTMLLAPTPMTLFWGADGILIYNDAYAAIAATRHPSILGASVFSAWPELTEFHRGVVTAVMAGKPLSYRDLSIVLHRNGEPEDAWFNVDYSPVLDDAGQPSGVLCVAFETTAVVKAQRDLASTVALLTQREAELAQVQKIGRIGGLEVDLRDGFVNRRSPEYLAVHGLPPSAIHESHEDWVARIHPQEKALAEGHFLEALRAGVHDYQSEYRIIRPSDGAVRWISAIARIERDDTGKPLRLVGAHSDITERKEAEAQAHLLMQELSHRVKNSLAMIQAIASQTFRTASSLEAARDTFGARLAALSRAHDLLVGGNWSRATLADIVAGVIGIQGEPERFAIAGPDVVVGPKSALALTLILHELGTNAVKYGSLSNQVGRVEVSWRIDDIDGETQFRLRWQEKDGPSITAPTRRGFGSRLIERTFPSAGSRTQSAYPPSGLVFTLDAPLDSLSGVEGDR